jgi:hypothetical protein
MLISSLSFNVKSNTVMDMSTPFSIVKLGCITVRGNWIKSESVSLTYAMTKPIKY